MTFVIGDTMVQIDLWLVILVLVVIAAVAAFVIIKAIDAHRFRQSAGWEELIGRTAEVKQTLDPKGLVFLEGENWSAVLNEGKAKVGEEVTIDRVEGLVLYVSKK